MRRLPLLFLSIILVAVPLVSCNVFAPLEEPIDYIPYNYDLDEYITLGNYRTLSVSRSEVTPTEEELKKQAESDFAPLMRLEDRPLELGDKVNLNYTAFFDGNEYDDDTENGFCITLGKNELGIPGFDEGLLGANPGDSISLDLSFPEDYKKTPEYAGKDVSFVVTVNYICRDLPELTDEMVSTYTTYSTVAAYQTGMKKTLTEVKTIEKLWNKLTEESRVLQYPEKEYENYHNEYLAGYTTLAEGYGMTLEELITSSGQSMSEFYEEADRVTKSYIKEDLIVYAIARAENITVTDEEYQRELLDYYNTSASNYYLSVELMEQSVGPEILREQFLSNKVLDFILQHSTVTED